MLIKYDSSKSHITSLTISYNTEISPKWCNRPIQFHILKFCVSVLYICSTVASLNIPQSPYSVITVDETEDNTLSEVSRRGYAGEDFYTKASKSIPRMGRRANLDPLCKSCSSSTEETNDLSNDITEDSNEILKIKLKRHHSVQYLRETFNLNTFCPNNSIFIFCLSATTFRSVRLAMVQRSCTRRVEEKWNLW